MLHLTSVPWSREADETTHSVDAGRYGGLRPSALIVSNPFIVGSGNRPLALARLAALLAS